jgi:beta-N-acetylhexosaminidase
MLRILSKYMAALLLATFLFSPFAVSASATPLGAEDETILEKMPLDVKIGQMLMIGFKGQDIDDSLGKMIQSVKPGAIVLFGRNIRTARQITDLNAAAQKLAVKTSGIPLLIAADQEGGNVVRIKTTYPLPSALALGLTDDTALVERAGSASGNLMKTLGLNMNLAPVMDVAAAGKSKFLGTRSFGSDPNLVTKMSFSFAAGLDASGVMPTAKHFPGHGGFDGDSHLGAVENDEDRSHLDRLDLAPFTHMAAQSKLPWAVMLAHVSYPALDPSKTPATFSKPIVTGLLRGKLGFNGIVLTDDIEMAGASTVANVNERAIRAVEAGADLIMIAWNRKIQSSVSKALASAVKSGRLSESRIDESLRRLLTAKRRFADVNRAKPSNDELKIAVKNEAFKDIAQAAVISRLAHQSAASNRKFQEFALDKDVVVFSANRGFSSQIKNLLDGERNVRTYDLASDSNSDSANPARIAKVMRSNANSVGVFYVSGRTVAKIASKLESDVTKRMLLVTVEPPGILPNFNDFKEVVDIYVRHPDLGKLIAEHYFRQETEAEPIRQPSSTTSSFTQDPPGSSQSAERLPEAQ